MFLSSLRVLPLFICIAAAQQLQRSFGSFPDMIDATWDSKRSLSRWPKWLSDMPPLGYQPRRMTSCIARSLIVRGPTTNVKALKKFKYGLDPEFSAYARVLGREGIIEKYNGRTISYAWGLEDHKTTLKRILDAKKSYSDTPSATDHEKAGTSIYTARNLRGEIPEHLHAGIIASS
ncbi:hypothetical protein ARMSODRAFT_978462 [Armillaria solidipes]|uniref:Uncharacterized protein n=1 Tax=Armillaria solidipes TaxID=1076256 RepID=A0A2H3B3B6_9AGAR|nr:hypothetical protein ARMSODRAFT_978462 [Armillaria solidipes]